MLLLGLLLLASDLAYIEAQFTLLGRHWAHHLLVVAAVYLVAACRWDSRTILGLALTTLAAWRGISVGLVSGSLWRGDAVDLRVNAIVLGALYVAAAWLAVRERRKAHFEEVFANGGLLLLLGALVSGVLGYGPVWAVWLVALLAVAGTIMWLAFRLGRSLYFARLSPRPMSASSGSCLRRFIMRRSVPLLLAALLGVAALALVFAAHRRMPER